MVTEDVEAVLSAGSNIIINSRGEEDMVKLAGAAKRAKVQLTIVGGMSKDVMLNVARAGGRYVTFDRARYKTREDG